MSKPSVSLVKVWDLEAETDAYTIHSGTAVFDGDYYKVSTSNGKSKLFYGETAWSDAERYANDYEMSVIYN
jgi:hypothetical protein